MFLMFVFNLMSVDISMFRIITGGGGRLLCPVDQHSMLLFTPSFTSLPR